MNDSQCDYPLNTILLPTLYNNKEECEANILLQVSNLPWQCQAKETIQVKKYILFSYQKCLYYKFLFILNGMIHNMKELYMYTYMYVCVFTFYIPIYKH